MKNVMFTLAIFLFAIPRGPIQAITADGIKIDIRTENGTERELEAAEKLKTILAKYKLQNWMYSTNIKISDNGLPHSHPVITLTTESEYFENDQSQLATFIHEQMHWYEEERLKSFKAAMHDLKDIYKNVPVGNGQGARSEYSTYLHLLIGWLEYDATIELYGSKVAVKLITQKDHYRWIYKTVKKDKIKIGKILADHNLIITPDQGIVW